MRRRSTFVHDAALEVNPAEIQVKDQQLLLGNFKAAREERLTFGFDELPEELWHVLQNSHELHIRWASERPNGVISPFVSSISPGLHVQYTPLTDSQPDLLCPLLKKTFSDGLKCRAPDDTFSRPHLVSERFASTSSMQYHSVLPSLTNLVAYMQRQVCSHSDMSCIHTASLLNIADWVDFDYDSISHTLVLTVFWAKPPAVSYDPIGHWTTYNGWNLDIRSTENDKVEVGILNNSPPPVDNHDMQLSGFLTVIGEDTSAKPTMFSFPSRHHILPPSQNKSQSYSVSFHQPTGLHPTLQISFPSASAVTEPQTKPAESTCALHTYLTLPSSIFADQYALSTTDQLFLSSHNLASLRSISGETDLEAPEYVVDRWGSNILLELAIPASDLKGVNSEASWNVTIPLHLRYLPPSAGGITDMEVPWPIVFWACTAEEGTRFPVNPFDRTNLGYDGFFGPRTMFYHLSPRPISSGRLVEVVGVPVLDPTAAGAEWVESGTVVVILLGFLWIVMKLWPGLRTVLGLGSSRAEGGQTKKTQ